MTRIYILIFIIAILGGIGYGAKYYYDTTQNKIAILTENNAQLEVAVETASASLDAAIENQEKLGALNKSLQIDLQKAVPLFILHDAMIFDLNTEYENEFVNIINKGYDNPKLGHFPLDIDIFNIRKEG